MTEIQSWSKCKHGIKNSKETKRNLYQINFPFWILNLFDIFFGYCEEWNIEFICKIITNIYGTKLSFEEREIYFNFQGTKFGVVFLQILLLFLVEYVDLKFWKSQKKSGKNKSLTLNRHKLMVRRYVKYSCWNPSCTLPSCYS